MRKFLALFITILLSIYLVGCGVTEDKTVENKENTLNPPLTSYYVACDGTSVTCSTEFVKEGFDNSLIFAHSQSGNSNDVLAVKFSESDEIEWATLNNATFYIYNSQDYDVSLELFVHMDASTTFFQDPQTVNSYTAKSKEWTEIVVSGRSVAQKMQDGTYTIFGLCVKLTDNDEINAATWQDLCLYLCGFEIFDIAN